VNSKIEELDGRNQELVQKSAALNVKIVSPEQVKEIYGYLDT
jgi:resolvase, N domain protein